MKFARTLNCIKFAAFVVLVAGVSASALASCGDSLAAIAAGTAAIASQSVDAQLDSQPSGGHSSKSSIVGLWHVQFAIGGQTVQEAYQIWNFGGTEVHNPNLDPRGGNVCLGAWKKTGQTYKLAHRVWNYDTNGNFLGTTHLSETLTLSNGGNTHTGSFTLDIYDPSGNFVNEVTGSVTGTRISVE